uniref:Uncharacterized protein n=1 Tax=Chromera velia CCMP2878 TaxID=1169474 RepID=A0A0G4GPZ2_9ALVE|eukprot:Cvel_22880.t1-p1 / transcript=Cvel_22880.t1 / gene=Cvel_22880 / organism=Chromera_velia_CCMP2878 / gene_product=hypothetical protein / transcript_product=hypothetical protein / location=Cvel_scaffold2298:4581-6757(-) / protein_length=398 / sequence_SO=supercontig / SO=protein_coding / is_pseudo=false
MDCCCSFCQPKCLKIVSSVFALCSLASLVTFTVNPEIFFSRKYYGSSSVYYQRSVGFDKVCMNIHMNKEDFSGCGKIDFQNRCFYEIQYDETHGGADYIYGGGADSSSLCATHSAMRVSAYVAMGFLGLSALVALLSLIPCGRFTYFRGRRGRKKEWTLVLLTAAAALGGVVSLGVTVGRVRTLRDNYESHWDLEKSTGAGSAGTFLSYSLAFEIFSAVLVALLVVRTAGRRGGNRDLLPQQVIRTPMEERFVGGGVRLGGSQQPRGPVQFQGPGAVSAGPSPPASTAATGSTGGIPSQNPHSTGGIPSQNPHSTGGIPSQNPHSTGGIPSQNPHYCENSAPRLPAQNPWYQSPPSHHPSSVSTGATQGAGPTAEAREKREKAAAAAAKRQDPQKPST